MRTIVLILCSVLSASTIEDEKIKLVKMFHEGNNKFTTRFFQDVFRTSPNISLVMSPYTVLTPLAQLSLLTEGAAQLELLEALGLPDIAAVKEVFRIIGNHPQVQGVTLKIVNRIFLGLQGKVKSEFNALSKYLFGSDIKNMNFGDSLSAVQDINALVDLQTEHHIKHIVRASSGGDTSAIIINAVYFKGRWAIPFDVKNTENREFFINRDKVVEIPTMFQNNRFLYGENKELKAQLLEIPYEHHEASFLVILPEKIDGLNELVEKLKDPHVVSAIDNYLYVDDINVYLPKFRIVSTIYLNDVLEHVGVQQIFSPEDARITQSIEFGEFLHMSNAVQKVLIEVDEKGAQVATTTGFFASETPETVSRTSALEFNANHSFVFAIKVHDEIMLTGVFRH